VVHFLTVHRQLQDRHPAFYNPIVSGYTVIDRKSIVFTAGREPRSAHEDALRTGWCFNVQRKVPKIARTGQVGSRMTRTIGL
jgi:hypothetical protein